ncbi:ribosome maturation factor RimM [Porcipelethomonas sp.]|uniref:ribosome maturation factor RimM n=1 Tax=Porcipelethomonas sp. TaxID=2981675 RepID=UPI003EF76A92
MKEFIETGKIVNIHGLQGEVKIMPWSDDPEFLCEFDMLYCGKNKTPYEVESARIHKNMVLVRFKGIDTAEKANTMRNSVVYINRSDIELEEGTYFIQDLIGLTVKDADTGKEYGIVSDIFQTGANDVYEIKGTEKNYLVPAIPDVIISTDISGGEILIRPLEGLFDED